MSHVLESCKFFWRVLSTVKVEEVERLFFFGSETYVPESGRVTSLQLAWGLGLGLVKNQDAALGT